ncbi:MAG: hypothetical protein R3A80_10195 [Bdellovibrionota bacterium]
MSQGAGTFKLAVIIPVSGEEPLLPALLTILNRFFELNALAFEILVVTAPNTSLPEIDCTIIQSAKNSRAHQMNLGAQDIDADYLWFVHADSTLTKELCTKVHEIVTTEVKASRKIYFFDLAFDAASPFMCRLNAFSANIRAKYFATPFGDQSYLMTRDTFLGLGGFPESFFSGEDHAFIQKAKEKNIQVISANETIITSGRKYSREGWLKTTLLHIYLTLKQEIKGRD